MAVRPSVVGASWLNNTYNVHLLCRRGSSVFARWRDTHVCCAALTSSASSPVAGSSVRAPSRGSAPTRWGRGRLLQAASRSAGSSACRGRERPRPAATWRAGGPRTRDALRCALTWRRATRDAWTAYSRICQHNSSARVYLRVPQAWASCLRLYNYYHKPIIVLLILAACHQQRFVSGISLSFVCSSDYVVGRTDGNASIYNHCFFAKHSCVTLLWCWTIML